MENIKEAMQATRKFFVTRVDFDQFSVGTHTVHHDTFKTHEEAQERCDLLNFIAVMNLIKYTQADATDELISRIESGETGHAIDVQIAKFAIPWEVHTPSYTTSIDAAASLIKKEQDWEISKDGCAYVHSIEHGGAEAFVKRNPAASLVVAWLRLMKESYSNVATPILPEHVSSRVYAVVMDAIREADAESPMKRAQLVVTAICDVLMQEQGIDTKQERCIYDI